MAGKGTIDRQLDNGWATLKNWHKITIFAIRRDEYVFHKAISSLSGRYPCAGFITNSVQTVGRRDFDLSEPDVMPKIYAWAANPTAV
jgi:hypothetical protein